MKKLLITKNDIKPSRDDFEVIGVFNPGCAVFHDKIVLLLRVAERPVQPTGEYVRIPLLSEQGGDVVIKQFDLSDPSYDFKDPRVIYGRDGNYLTSMSHFRIAISDDGENFTVGEKPAIMPSGKYEKYGIEDPRITCINGAYKICYSCSSEYGILGGLISTEDFVSFERKGYLFHPDNKDVVIFPSEINGKYYALHRPSLSQFGKCNMWIAESEDLVSWGNHRVVMTARDGFFDSGRVGAGCVPFLTDSGWIELYHGATENNEYAMGAVLLDKNDPGIVLARTDEPLLFPTEPYEIRGFFGKVVFGCGCVVQGDKAVIYYGAADECVAKSELAISDIMRKLK